LCGILSVAQNEILKLRSTTASIKSFKSLKKSYPNVEQILKDKVVVESELERVQHLQVQRDRELVQVKAGLSELQGRYQVDSAYIAELEALLKTVREVEVILE